jgi:hypothetical protein
MERQPEEDDLESYEFEDDPIDKAFRRLLELDEETFDQFVAMKPPWE